MTHTAILFLLLLPVEPENLPAQADPISWQSLKDVAEMLELCPRAGNWELNWGREVCWCWRTWREVRDAPPLSDVHRWPSAAYAQAMMDRNCDFRRWLDAQECAYLFKSARINEMQVQARRLHAIWWCVLRAKDGYGNYVYVHQRHALAELRELLGERDYYEGRLPPPVPSWWFSRIEK